MKAWFFVILALCAAEDVTTPGRITLSNLEVFPCTPGALWAMLDFKATLGYRTPSANTILTIVSDYPFIPANDRNDCFIRSNTEAWVSHCESNSTTLTASLISNTDYDIDSFSFTVMRAFDLPKIQSSRNIEIRLSWNDVTIDTTEKAMLPLLEQPYSTIRNVTFVFKKAMINEFSTLNVSFQPDFTMQRHDLVYLLFPSEFDSVVGKMKDENMTFGCQGNSIAGCKVSYYGIKVEVKSIVSNETFLNITVEDIRMPAKIIDSDIGIYVYRDSSLFAVDHYNVNLAPDNFNISCCILYDRIPECHNVSMSVCSTFGFNIASFSDDMNRIYVKFKQRMEVSNFRKCGTRCENCNTFFEASTVVALGKEPKCRWTDSDELTVYLGTYPNITNGRVNFKSNVLKTFKGKPWNVKSIRLFYPPSFPPPIPVISVVGSINHCGDMKLDCIKTTGTGRRHLNCTWFVNENYRGFGDLLFLNSSEIENEQEAVSVRMEAVNAWGLKANTSTLVPIVSESKLSVSFPFGNFTQFNYSKGLTFQPNIIPSTCMQGDTINDYIYQWTFNAPQMKDKCTQRTCSINKGDLPIGYYSLNFTVTAIGLAGQYSSFTNVTFRITPSRIQIIVTGASCTVNVNETNTFKSETVNPDTGEPVMVSWSLLDKDKNETDLVDIIGTEFRIPKNYMNPRERYYLFVTALNIERPSDSFWIDTTEDAILRMAILPTQIVNPSTIVKVNPEVPETTFKEIRSINCSWSQITDHNYQAISHPTAPILVFASESLDQGLEYTFEFKCDAVLTNNKTAISRAQTTIYVNQPPTGGVFEISPDKGIPLETEFSLSGKNWKDSEGNYPLTYQFSTMVPGEAGDVYLPFTLAVLEANYTTRLGNTTNVIVLFVCDSLGACSRTRENVTFVEPVRERESVKEPISFKTNKKLNEMLAKVIVTNDTRNSIATTNAISDSLSKMVKSKLLKREDAQKLVKNITEILKNTTSTLFANNIKGLTTELQEALLTSIMKAMIRDITDEQTISELLNIFDRTVSLRNTRSTTGTIAVQALSRLQDFIDFANVSSPYMADLTTKVQDLNRKLSQSLVATLSPGQFPINQTESSMVVYAVRNTTNMIENKSIRLPINGDDVKGTYSVTLPDNLISTPDRVIDVVITARRVPPYAALPQISLMLICSFYYFQDDEDFSYAPSCKGFSIQTSSDLIGTVYPVITVRDVGKYDQQTGDVAASNSSNVTAVQLPAGTKFNQTIPFAFSPYEKLQCFSETSEGIMTTEVCKLVYRSELKGICECSMITGAIIKRELNVEDVLPKWVESNGGGERLISGEFSGAVAIVIFSICIIVSLVNLMRILDSLEVHQIKEVENKFNDFASELVYLFSEYNFLVNVKLYSTCCILTDYFSWLYYVLRCKKRNKKLSLEYLFFLMYSNKISAKVFTSGIKSACSQIKEAENPDCSAGYPCRCAITHSKCKCSLLCKGHRVGIINKWTQCDVMETFCLIIDKSDSFRLSMVHLFFQYCNKQVRVHAQSSAPAVPISKWVIDDLIKQRSFWGRFVANNQILCFFLQRSVIFSRINRLPIILVNLFAPMTSYILNFDNINSNQIKSLPELLISGSGRMFYAGNGQVTFVITAIFLVATFVTEKILLKFPYLLFIKKEHQPRFNIRQSSTKRCLLKVAIGIGIPIAICSTLLFASVIKTINFGVNDTLLVIKETAIGFIGAVLVGFHLVALVFVLVGDFWEYRIQPLLKAIWKFIMMVTRGWIISVRELMDSNFLSEEFIQ